MLTRSQSHVMSTVSEKPTRRYQTRNVSIIHETPVHRVHTRSQTALENKADKFSVNIDFDNASHEWRKNKRTHGNGMFSYKKGYAL